MIIKVIAGVVILVVVIIILFFAIFVDSKLIFWYLTDKKSFKKRMLRKFAMDGTEVLFLGTVHDMHFNFEEYSFYHLKAVLQNYKPDVLLVESRQSELELGNYADGPIEMFYLSMIARNMDIPVFGVDWFDHNSHKPGTTNRLRDEHIFNNVENYVRGYKKPLVVIGATHLLVGNRILKNKGFNSIKQDLTFFEMIFKENDKNLLFDKSTVSYLHKRIERENEFLKNNDLDEKWCNATNIQIQNIERFIKKIKLGEIKIDV